ncbi:MAG: hypothetical protein RDU14_05145 [Melioribacteraceae bacterium]|nr:hypothetical protein [Melioribacteraceae bacterium]
MMNSFMVAAIICLFVGIGYSIAIISYLQKHGVKINWLLIRLFLPEYVSQYNKMTEKEYGKPGNLYYMFVVCMVSAVILAIIGLLIKRM